MEVGKDGGRKRGRAEGSREALKATPKEWETNGEKEQQMKELETTDRECSERKMRG